MPLRAAAIALLAPLAWAAAQDADPEGILWHHDLERAAAAESGRPLIAYFTFDGCYWCDRLEEDSFSDPRVIELSRRFTWVKVDRDRTPEVPRRFSVSAYPSLLTLGEEMENVHRFSGYSTPEPFMERLEEALRRHALYRAGEKWDAPEPRPERICDEGELGSISAPSEDVPAGIAFRGDELWGPRPARCSSSTRRPGACWPRSSWTAPCWTWPPTAACCTP